MEAVAEKGKTTVKAKYSSVTTVKKPIPEDTNFMVVRFQNMESAKVPLEFSAGAPIRSYVLKDGLCYNLPERLRNHIAGLYYPVYNNVPDPNFPDSGQYRSMQTGKKYRFVLSTVIDDKDPVYEHLREKLNCKISPAMLSETTKAPKASADVLSAQKQQELVNDNTNLMKKLDEVIEQNKDLAFSLNKAKGENKDLKKSIEVKKVEEKDSKKEEDKSSDDDL